MRRLILRGPILLLSAFLAGCTGMGVFFDHTFSFFGENPNAPAGSSENLLRARGQSINISPLQPEPGNVWPGPQAPDPTLSDIEQQQNRETSRNFPLTTVPNPGLPAGAQPRPVRPGSSTPPDSTQPGLSLDGGTPNVPPPPRSSLPGSTRGGVVNTPRGPAVDTGGGNGRYRTLESPLPGNRGILVPNGNGTSTLIGPDGSVQTVPTPK